MNVRRLIEWAKQDRARVFEVRFIASARHPWEVSLENDQLGWSARVDCETTLKGAIDRVLRAAEAEEHPPTNIVRVTRLSKTGLLLKPAPVEPVLAAADREFGESNGS